MKRLDIETILFKPPRVVWHLVFWVVFISFFALVYGSFNDDYGKQYLALLTDAVVQAPAVYFSLYVLMPKFLFRDRYAQFIAALVVVILVFSTLIWFAYVFVQAPAFWPEYTYEGPLFNVSKILKYTTKIYPILVLSIVIKWFKYWFVQQKANQQLVKEKLTAELNFLKAQVHPHFLFNTLNNLYALTLRQSPEAPEVVLKLSALLDYMLYECNADRVPLEREIKLVKDYIALEQIRYGDRLNVTFNISGEVKGHRMAPLMILPFVENSFKHGVSEELDDSWVSIDLEGKEHVLIVKVENSKSKSEEVDDQLQYKKGIGLKNVKRRLELLYPDTHELNTYDAEGSFLVVLKLDLAYAD